jgi:hypothetical protein
MQRQFPSQPGLSGLSELVRLTATGSGFFRLTGGVRYRDLTERLSSDEFGRMSLRDLRSTRVALSLRSLAPSGSLDNLLTLDIGASPEAAA